MNLKQLTAGQQISENFAVLHIEKKQTSNAKPYLVADLCCQDGSIKGKVWENNFATASLEAGKVYKILGSVDIYQQMPNITINQAFELEEQIDKYLKPKPTIIFDIETAGKSFDELSEWDQDYFLNTLQRREEDREAAKEKTALYPLYGQVVSIAMYNPFSQKGMVYIIGKDIVTLDDSRFTCQSFTTEKELLEAFWLTCTKYERYVTFNGSRFDFPFLMMRSAFHKVKIPFELDTGNHDRYVDLYYKFMGEYGFKLEALCRFLGITNPKEKGVSGLHVSKLFKEGKIEDIANYVCRDVISTTELYAIWKDYMAGKLVV